MSKDSDGHIAVRGSGSLIFSYKSRTKHPETRNYQGGERKPGTGGSDTVEGWMVTEERRHI